MKPQKQMNSIFWLLIFVVFGLTTTNCTNLPTQRDPTAAVEAAASRQNHFVITIHGIGGVNEGKTEKERKKSTFGYLDVVLQKHLTMLRPNENTYLLSFQYPTGTTTQSTFNFAFTHLNTFLDSELPKYGFKSGDKITFIAHSQGGIITSIWYAGIKLEVDPDGNPAPQLSKYQVYAQATEKIITVGTPFWGSKLAALLLYKEGFDVETQTWIAKLLDLGIRELKEMNFLSNTIYKFRKTAIALSSKPDFKEKFQDAPEFINIGGVFPTDSNKLFYPTTLVPSDKSFGMASKAVKLINDKIKSRAFASELVGSNSVSRYESDVAVIIPSGRSQFLYTNHQATCDKDNYVFNSEFEMAQIFPKSKYILTESIHAPLMSARSVGMAHIPQFCEDPEKCVHPTYRYILRYAAACDQGSEKSKCDKANEHALISRMFMANREDSKRSQDLSDAKDLQGFSIDISLKVPLDYELPVSMYRRPVQFEPYLIQDLNVFRQVAQIDQSQLENNVKYNRQRELVEIKAPRQKELLAYTIAEHEMEFRGEQTKAIRLHLTGIVKPRIDYTNNQSKSSSENTSQSYEQYLNLIGEGVSLPIRIKLPKTSPMVRKNDNSEIFVEAKIRPGFSTFIDVDYRDGLDCSSK